MGLRPARGILSRVAGSLWIACTTLAATPAPQIHDVVRGHTHHLLMLFTLTPDNTVFPGADPRTPASPGASFQPREGGQFEVMIRKTAFPIPAPGCPRLITLRMPWTNPAAPAAQAAIQEKQALFARLDEMRRGLRASVAVGIDLKPYVKQSPGPQPNLELTACNVFFRDEGGHYVGPEDAP